MARRCMDECMGSFRRFMWRLTALLEEAFYRLGKVIARRPWVTILVSLLCCALCGVGLVSFFEVNASDPIWVDPGAPVIAHQNWIKETFPSRNRFASFVIVASDVLSPAALTEMLELDTLVKQINGTVDGEDYNWDTICAQLFTQCWTNSILELWNFSTPVIQNLNKSEILSAVNSNNTRSEYYEVSLDVSTLLGWQGGQKPAKPYNIVPAATLSYFTKAVDPDAQTYVSEDKYTKWAEDFEKQFLELRNRAFSNIDVYAFATRSFSDEAGSSILGDVVYLSVGYIIIIAFLSLILGRFNCLEQRIYLAIAGVLGVGLSILVSFGLSSASGRGYGPVQSILPFLLLGIGVDDVFVIVQSWNVIRGDPAQMKKTLEERAGLALKHAGISITVTSITDLLAFSIGISTKLPALSDFCVYAAFGVAALYLVQATFFSACVVLDTRRVEAGRNACCCCVRHSDTYQASECSKRDLQQTFFDEVYGPLLTKIPVKVVVLLITGGVLGLTIYGTINLKQEFDPRWFIPSDSYASRYLAENDAYFSKNGVTSGEVYIGDLDLYSGDRTAVMNMMTALNASQWVDSSTFECWYCDFDEYLQTIIKCPYLTKYLSNTTNITSSGRWWPSSQYNYDLMAMVYLQRSVGAKYNKDIRLNPDYDDNATTPLVGGNGRNTNFSALNETVNDPIIRANLGGFQVTASRVTFDLVAIPSSDQGVMAMDQLRALTAAHVPERDGGGRLQAFAYGEQFETWETDKVIQLELYRNIGIAFAAIVVVTLLFLADIRSCLFVSGLIIITLVNVGGFMYFWNLTIDTVTAIQFVLAIGLAVDYSAHIGHSFMTVSGTKDERVRKTMSIIGPAVFNGGFSTFLAFVLLAISTSYVFTVFFKVNLLVVSMGLWNGLVVLPVILSLVGPPPYPNTDEEPDKDGADPGELKVKEPLQRLGSGKVANGATADGHTTADGTGVNGGTVNGGLVSDADHMTKPAVGGLSPTLDRDPLPPIGGATEKKPEGNGGVEADNDTFFTAPAVPGEMAYTHTVSVPPDGQGQQI